MSAQILRKRRTLAMRRLALAAIGVSYFVLSGTTFGADIGIANPSAVAAALGERHATAHPTEPPAINAKTRSAFVDGLYKESLDMRVPTPNIGAYTLFGAVRRRFKCVSASLTSALRQPAARAPQWRQATGKLPE